MNKETQDLQDLELLLQRHACRAGVDRLRSGLSSGYAGWNRRRQHRVDVLRYAVAASFAIVLLPLAIMKFSPQADPAMAEINNFANNLILA